MICLPLPRSSAGVPRKTISPRKIVGDRRERDRGADPRCRHRVVAAAMAKPGQCVVLGEDPDTGPVAALPTAPGRPDRRREAAGRVLDLEAVSCGALSATQAAAWCSSNAGSGSAWMRCERSMISSRAASTAAATRSLSSMNGSAGRRAVRSGTGPPGVAWLGPDWDRSDGGWYGRRALACSAFGGQRRLGDRGEGDDEQGDRQFERRLQPQHDEDRDDQADPSAAAGRADPVSAVGDPAVPREDDQPEDRREGERDRQPDQRRADEAGDRFRDWVAGGDDQRDEDPDQYREPRARRSSTAGRAPP